MVEQNRSLLKWLLLGIVTCGIYDLYFIYKLAQDVNKICEGDGDNTPGLLSFILLTLVTCGIYGYYWYYKLGDRLFRNGPRYNIQVGESGGTILLYMLINLISGGIGTILATHFIIRNTNSLAAAYNTWTTTGALPYNNNQY